MAQKRKRVVWIVLVGLCGIVIGACIWRLTDRPVFSKEADALALCQMIFTDHFVYGRQSTTFSYSYLGDPSTHVEPIAEHQYHVTSVVRTDGPTGIHAYRYDCIARDRGDGSWWFDHFEQEEITASP